MKSTITRDDRMGLARAGVDAHTLGLSSVAQLLGDCGIQSVMADAAACQAFGQPLDPASAPAIERWLRANHITALGFSYRLDPQDGAALCEQLVRLLKSRRLLSRQGGPLRALYFAGLPRACELVRRQVPDVAGFFCGDETPAESLRILGIHMVPSDLAAGMAYDEARLSFGRDLIERGDYLGAKPAGRDGYEGFGTAADTVVARIRHGIARGLPPLVRAHVGPYLPDRVEAVRLLRQWTRQLATSGFLDILSIGTSQLTQSAFGEEWNGRPNGGGVPLNSPEEFAEVWRAARPMLVHAYAGTKGIPELARMYEETIHTAWHALSLWWFCRIDGRGPNSVQENLREHLDTLRYVASTGKPFEPNIPHHFAFRGADDVTCVVSAVLAARVARSLGIRFLILQTMLNTPKTTWGVQDLAKARAMLVLLREIEDERFRVILQPRGGLDYFSSDLGKAKAQLAAVTALMDDIEPHDPASPPIIHVVSYSEASHLADPPVIDESIQITRHALEQYRTLRAKGQVDDMANHPEVMSRTSRLIAEARTVLKAIDAMVPEACTAEGLYKILAWGFLPVPWLWECREEFASAVQWPTRVIHGAVKVVDEQGAPISAAQRMRRVAAELMGRVG